MTTLKSLACSIIFRGIPLPQLRHHHLDPFGGFNMVQPWEIGRILSRTHVAAAQPSKCKQFDVRVMWRTGVPTIQTWSSKQATNSVPSCHPNCRDLNKPKALHQCFDALQVRDHLVRHLKKCSTDQTLGKTNIFQVDLVLTCCFMWNVYSLQLYTSRMLQLFNFPNQKTIHSYPPLRPRDQ